MVWSQFYEYTCKVVTVLPLEVMYTSGTRGAWKAFPVIRFEAISCTPSDESCALLLAGPSAVSA